MKMADSSVSGLFHGDCLLVMQDIRDSSIDMVYLDPPFFTQEKQVLSAKDNRSKSNRLEEGRWDN